MSHQQRLMTYCPAKGTNEPYPSHAAQWREFHGQCAWLWNPWTVRLRDARDVGPDPFGHLILDGSEVKAAHK
jgi:hypothetical protein